MDSSHTQTPLSCTVDDTMYDVVQIGYGPVGQANAAMLGQAGHSVAVFERHPSLFEFSRAGHIDHEIMRILQSIGCADAMDEESVSPDNYDWVTADLETMIRFPWPNVSVSGWKQAYLFFQPVLEAAIDHKVRGLPTVNVTQGWEAIAVQQFPDHVEVTVQPKGGGGTEQRVVRGRYLVAADGGSSFVRQHLDLDFPSLGYKHGWLVLDFEFTAKNPMKFEFDNGQICDPQRPTSLFEMGKHRHRFSFAAMPGETEEMLLKKDTAWDLVRQWVTPDTAELIRQTYYVFEARILDDMQHGRVLFVGDSAHVMPPFLGQGLCSGMRDAINLSWKLDLVLRGHASEALLDTYSQERRSHTKRYAELSMELGKILCMTDPVAAKKRDEDFLEGNPPKFKPFPWIESGLIQNDPPEAAKPLVGRLGPQGVIELNGRRGRADDVLGVGWCLISRTNLWSTCRESSRHLLEDLGFRLLDIGPTGNALDVDQKYTTFLSDNGLEAILVRPDFYVFGGVESPGDVDELLDDLRAQLQLTPRLLPSASSMGGFRR